MLKTLLKNKECFKLICGAGNEDITEVEKLVALYAKAGARFFDLSANEDVIKAAKQGLKRVIPENELNNYHLCVSIGTTNDPHTSKAVIDEQCIQCGKCVEICSQKAVLKDNKYYINEARCIGCGHCKAVCPSGSISFYSKNLPLQEILPPLIELGIDCIELHATGINEDELYDKWNFLNNHFDGILSICIGRSHLGNTKLIGILRNLLVGRKDYTTIIQTDGNSMTGLDDKHRTTLQAVATAEIVQNANLPAFIILCGGTNSKTAELAKLCEIDTHGLAVGSFARKIVRNYIDREDFLENEEIFSKAVKIAKNLVDNVL